MPRMQTPPLPTLRQLTNSLRELNAAYLEHDCGECHVWLYLHGAGWDDASWQVDTEKLDWPGSRHSELCGVQRFDATAAARRLLINARWYLAERDWEENG